MNLQLESGPPWRMTLRVSWSQDEVACALAAPDAGAPLRFHASWSRERTTVRTDAVGPLSDFGRSSAHRLTRSARRDVRLELALSLPEGWRDPAARLVERACRALGERCIRARLERIGSLAGRVAERASALQTRVADFLATPLDLLLARHAGEAARIQREDFGGRIRLFAPLYVSNACSNDCVYCGFRRSARFARTQLTVEQALAEARRLAAAGQRSIDLVTGEIPTDAFVDHVARTVRRVRAETPIEHVQLNVGALSSEQFRELRRAGAAGYNLYQETYDTELYLELHPSGPKRDSAWRLEGLHRALEAGFPKAGLGILLGLRDPAAEIAALVAHAECLREDFPQARLGFSLPRWRPVDAACSFAPAAPAPDDLLAAALLFLRLESPRAHLTLTTRESAALRDRLVPLGVTRLSAGVSTAVGGYGHPAGKAQFAVLDSRPLESVARSLRAQGLTPVTE